MRKYSKFLVLALCTAIVLSFTGCGNKADTSSKENDSSTSEDKTKKEEEEIDENVDYSDYIKLGDYSSIELNKSDIDSKTELLITSNIKKTDDFKKVKKGTVKEGDMLNIYYVGKIDGKEFEGGSCKKKDSPDGYNLEIGSGGFIDGFEDGLIGKKIGEKCDLNIKFPDSYPNNPDLEGKPVVFTVTINYRAEWPELSDKFVEDNFKDFYKGYKNTAEDYTKYIRDSVVMDMAWENVYTASKINDYPEDLLKQVKKQYRTPVEYYLKQQGVELEGYLAMQSMTAEDFDKQVETSAKSDLGKRMVFNTIAHKENIVIGEDEFKEVLDMYLKEYSVESQDELDKLFEEYYGSKSENIINNEVLYKKVNEFLATKVKEK